MGVVHWLERDEAAVRQCGPHALAAPPREPSITLCGIFHGNCRPGAGGGAGVCRDRRRRLAPHRWRAAPRPPPASVDHSSTVRYFGPRIALSSFPSYSDLLSCPSASRIQVGGRRQASPCSFSQPAGQPSKQSFGWILACCGISIERGSCRTDTGPAERFGGSAVGSSKSGDSRSHSASPRCSSCRAGCAPRARRRTTR